MYTYIFSAKKRAGTTIAFRQPQTCYCTFSAGIQIYPPTAGRARLSPAANASKRYRLEVDASTQPPTGKRFTEFAEEHSSAKRFLSFFCKAVSSSKKP